MIHRGCITDRLAKEYWRDYQREVREGNALGLSFTEYVANRVLATATFSLVLSNPSPWYVSACGHKHPWGESCGNWTAT